MLCALQLSNTGTDGLNTAWMAEIPLASLTLSKVYIAKYFVIDEVKVWT